MVRQRRPGWLAGIGVVATDLAESYRAGLSPHLDHATRVADPFHVVRVANRCMDQVRRRVQNEQLGHRGRKRDPLYRIRKMLLAGTERIVGDGTQRMLLGLRAGDPDNEILGAWLAKESVRDVTRPTIRPRPKCCWTRRSAAASADAVAEIRSLGETLQRWRAEILAHHDTGASNGPTEGLNLLVKEVKRCGRGFENFEHYRLRVLLRAGKPTWPQRPTPPIDAEILEYFAGAEQVPDHVGEAVGDGDGGLVRSSPVGDLAVLGGEVAGLGAGRGAG